MKQLDAGNCKMISDSVYFFYSCRLLKWKKTVVICLALFILAALAYKTEGPHQQVIFIFTQLNLA